jgi:hypothetical protein
MYVIYTTNIVFQLKYIVKWNVGPKNQKRKKVDNKLGYMKYYSYLCSVPIKNIYYDTFCIT